MTLTRFQKIALGISGITAFGIGAAILTAPHAFYAGYGIALGTEPSLLSELRAPAASLAAFGLLMLAGIVRQGFAPVSMAVALTVFLAFPAGRLVGVLVDGIPSAGLLGALAVELGIAGLCLVAFRPRPATLAKGGRRVTAP
ncbi:membrane protein [Rhodovulum sp. P5]|uniref:DUF4345 domain-containing protein n=1 Tax=Rhodovulum sp. P5 TaxID=1564506 RepID=UPI0009C34D3A|nr:DUF4345 domain-containing protein [Rhodovulum sp. P5]ARE39703.1 membrane protein [Rhodovulum sp. P5]